MKRPTRHLLFALSLASAAIVTAQAPSAGADERTPSKAEYFSWINNTNEGPSDRQTRVNFDFFRYMKERYGMQLDLYAFDAGAVDGAKMYGSTCSARFARQFPQGFAPIAAEADSLGFRLGLWGGPDGFGTTPEEVAARTDMMVGLVRDHNFRLFKLDAVCGQLPTERAPYFDRMMTEIRRIAPDFIFLNHRLALGEAERHATTFLLGGEETYIDVHMTNKVTAPHHRAQAIARLAPGNLTRLTEDHGVCLSSCLDHWEDDLILQAFNRNLILAPQIYANPWLLRDDELPYLAFVYNLHRTYRDILVDGMHLPADIYGTGAIARGDSATRFITLRNLSWEPVRYSVTLDASVGLTDEGEVKARQYHPYILDLGNHAYGTTVEVEVLPFATALVKLTTAPEKDRAALSGIPYHIVSDRPGHPVEVKLLGMPGHTYRVKLDKGTAAFSSASLDGRAQRALVSGRTVNIRFDGTRPATPWHYKAADLQACAVPADAEAIYYATCFAADNNALEVRSLQRSGATAIPQVQAARDAFFNQALFREREIWDRCLFDDDPATAFSVALRWGDPRPGGESGFCLDLGRCMELDRLTLTVPDEYSLAPLKSYEGVQAYVSADLHRWQAVTFVAGRQMDVDLSRAGGVRYVRFAPCPLRLTEVRGYKDGREVTRDGWRASNLFRPYGSYACNATQAWKGTFTVPEVHPGAYLCVAVNGQHGEEGAWAAFKIDGQYVGCPDRAPSFASNTWEYKNASSDRNYTYYLPLTPDMAGKEIEATVIALGKNEHYIDLDRPEHTRREAEQHRKTLRPEVWVTAHPLPLDAKPLVLAE